jgi:hypothetical protein
MLKHPLPLLLVLLSLTCTALASDVEYSTAGAMDTPATLGGDRDGWGTEFVTRWDNDTGQDVVLEEFGWPCGGWWAQFWYVWITDTIPDDPYTLEYYGTFVSESDDDTEWPPSTYTYVDVSEEGIVVPAGASMYFGYSNPGMAGQVAFNGVETFSWFEDAWDLDGDFGRTTILQFRGSFAVTAATGALPRSVTIRDNHPNPFNPATTITYTLPRAMTVSLEVYSLRGRPVRRLQHGPREAGTHHVAWDGTDQQRRPVPSGIYLARLVTEAGVETHKMVLAK